MLSANLGAGYNVIDEDSSITSTYAGAPGAAFKTPSMTHTLANGTEVGLRDDAEARSGFTNQGASFKARWAFSAAPRKHKGHIRGRGLCHCGIDHTGHSTKGLTAMAHHAPTDHWERHARTWQHFGSPLRPCGEDVSWMEQALHAIQPTVRQAVLLGVTPELAHMRWPASCRLLAVDQNAEMIRLQWQSNPPANGQVLCGDWQYMPLAEGSVDAIVGDGVLVFFAQPDGVRPLLNEFRRLLSPHGRWLLRVFVRPEQGESLEQVHEALANGQIGSFHAYKWRLAMALQSSLASGVRPADVWRAWRQRVSSAASLSAATGWSMDEIDTIEAYRESPATYYFPTLAELRQLLVNDFDILDLHIPSYELGERCPLLALGTLPA